MVRFSAFILSVIFALMTPAVGVGAQCAKGNGICKCSKNQEYSAAEQAYLRGLAEMKYKRYTNANHQFDVAIKQLSDVYLPKQVVNDDSGLLLIEANIKAKAGNFRGAAEYKRDAVSTRLGFYSVGHDCLK